MLVENLSALFQDYQMRVNFAIQTNEKTVLFQLIYVINFEIYVKHMLRKILNENHLM